VVSAYNFTCALTAYRLTTITAGSIVDAAHIHEFRDSRNNDPRNGIALSKNAHWTFDQGYGRYRTIFGSSLQSGNLQKQVQTRIIYSPAIMAKDFICRKIEPFGPTQFILLGTER